LPRRDDAQAVQDGPPRLVGYARISTDDQTTALQADALTCAAVDVVFEEEASGANTARPVLAKTLETLRSGDTLVVWRLDHVLDGNLTFFVSDARIEAAPGAFVYLPRFVHHGFQSNSTEDRVFNFLTPAGVEQRI
jgi:hypothetical protein